MVTWSAAARDHGPENGGLSTRVCRTKSVGGQEEEEAEKRLKGEAGRERMGEGRSKEGGGCYFIHFPRSPKKWERGRYVGSAEVTDRASHVPHVCWGMAKLSL